MKIVKNFNSFINEDIDSESTPMECKCCSLSGEITLYRLTSHPVIDLSTPGEFYVCDESAIDPDLLERKEGDELFLITVKCDASNINMEQSEKECVILENPNIIAVNNDSDCEIISVTPYNVNQPLQEGLLNEEINESGMKFYGNEEFPTELEIIDNDENSFTIRVDDGSVVDFTADKSNIQNIINALTSLV